MKQVKRKPWMWIYKGNIPSESLVALQQNWYAYEIPDLVEMRRLAKLYHRPIDALLIGRELRVDEWMKMYRIFEAFGVTVGLFVPFASLDSENHTIRSDGEILQNFPGLPHFKWSLLGENNSHNLRSRLIENPEEISSMLLREISPASRSREVK
ncbi:hypothetical protein HY408_02250 [Candidatus Gottesmanbacteria bacterium]|nr:hypothetical protein [Candidatus Gottesmanbacteria bacterium]